MAHLSHRSSVRLSVRLSVCHTGESVKNSASQDHQIFTVSCQKTLVLGSVKVLHKFERGHLEQGH